MFTSNFGGGSTFGSAFSGAPTQSHVFGQTAPQQPTSLFGGGGFNQPKTTFGTSFGSPSTTSMFGQNRLNNPPSTMFGGGQTATVSPFSSANANQNQAGTSIPFNAITGTDTMMRNGVASPINTRHQCITCMKEYENKSLEELRLEDYQLNRKGPPQNAIFGGAQPQQSTSIFSSMNSNTGPVNTFGQGNTTFGTPSASSGLFSTLNQPKPATSFFSSQNPTATSAFGGGSTFSFSNQPSQPTSIFASNNNATSTAGTLGSSFSFQQPQQPAIGGGLFGQKPLTPATSASPGFGFGTGSTTMAKPGGLFGTPPTSTTFGAGTTPQFGTGTGGLFSSQQPQQQKQFSFSTPFSTQPAVSSAFGAPSTQSNFQFNTATSAPSLGFTNTVAPTFGAGNTGGTSFSGFGATPNFSIGNPTTSSGFGAPSFSFSTPSVGTGFSLFNQSNSFAQPNQQPQTTTPAVPFATTPYKDSPLFYNLITNRSLEELTKPTNPMAQRAIKEASRRRHSTSFNTTGSSNVKNFTIPIAKTQPFSKQVAIFDGFEDETGSSVDILSPKSSIKTLSLKSIKNLEKPRFSFPSFNRTNSQAQTSALVDSTHVDFEESQLNNTFDDSGLNISRANGDFGLPCKSSENVNDSFHSGGGGDVNYQGNDANDDGNSAILKNFNGVDQISHRCNVICTRPGYYIHPKIEDLDLKTDERNNCIVKGFFVGRLNYGEIRFLEVVNVAGVNIDEIVMFRHKEVVVYPDDDAKPPVGEGLNCPAEITLERVWPIDKTTKDPIKSPTKIIEMNYENLLRRACIRLDAEFVSYNAEAGTWKFQVKHFSKYNCDVEENEEDEQAVPPIQQLKGKGLGGIPAEQLAIARLEQSKLMGKQSEPGTSTLTSMLMQKTWSDRDTVASNLQADMPVFHTLMSSTVSGKTTSSEEDKDDYDYVNEGEIEHNPLTPSESEESEKDTSKFHSAPTTHESVLDGNVRSPRVNMMKSMLSFFPGEEDYDMFYSQDHQNVNKAANAAGKSYLMYDRVRSTDDFSIFEESNVRRPLPPKVRKSFKTQNFGGGDMGSSTLMERKSSLSTSISGRVLTEKAILNESMEGKYPCEVSNLSPMDVFSKARLPSRKKRMSSRMNTSDRPISVGGKTGSMEYDITHGKVVDHNIPLHTVRRSPSGALYVNATGPPMPPYKSRTETAFKGLVPQRSLFSDLSRDAIAGLKRGCCRVSFLRNGQLVYVTNNKVNWKGSDAISGQVSIYNKSCYDAVVPQSMSRVYIETMNKQMNIELTVRQNFDVSTSNVISFHKAILDEASRSSIELDDENSAHFSKLLLELQVWSLCDILWSSYDDEENHDDSYFYHQRERLSKWFKNNRVYLFGWKDAPRKETSPLELVRYGMEHEACELAVVQENYNIALLLSQRDEDTAYFCQEQLAAWTEMGALEFIPEDVQELYRIFSGPRLPSTYSDVPMTNQDWLQNFAIHLWYSCPSTWSVKQVISSYLDIVRTQVEEYKDENEPSQTNLYISLLKLYGSVDYPLKFILDSRRSNLGSLEYKLPFLLMNNLDLLGYTADPTIYENVCLGFAGQLDTMGLYDWAIFVLQYLPPQASTVLIDGALQKYIKCGDYAQAELFLTLKLGIPEKQIFALKALHASSIKRSDHELWYLIKCGDYKGAYKIFAEKLFTICINCKKNEPKILWILDVLYEYSADIPEWKLHGQLVRSFLTLQKIQEANLTSEFDTQTVESNIKNFLSSFVQYKSKDDSESAFLLELALSAQKMVALLVMDNKLRQIEEDNEVEEEENNLNNLMKLPVPNEYMSSVQKFVATWMAV